MKIPFAYRAANEEDVGYILRSWLKTWRDEPRNKEMPNDLYYKQAHSMFKLILNKFGAIIACNPEDPSQIYAFAVAAYLPNDEWALFWIQTKSIYSHLGIGTALYNFIKGERAKGPVVPFMRNKLRYLTQRLDLLDAPYMIAQLITMEVAQPVTKLVE